jgi:hypothetical protein
MTPFFLMIVRPDFPDHFKTRMLVDLTGDRGAPVMLLRLWGHCQQRRASRFKNLSPATLKAICRADEIDADRFHSIMVQTGFIDLEGDETVVHDWDEVNGALLRNWENGKKGGRPRGAGGEGGHKGSPEDKRQKPAAKNPKKTPGFSGDNPNETDGWIEGLDGEEESKDKSFSPGDAGAGGEGGHKGSPEDKRQPCEDGPEGGSDGVPPADKRGPLQQIVDLYHATYPFLPKVQKVAGQRLKSVRVRWKAAGKQPLEWFGTLFRMAAESTRIREGTWCSFDWLMSPQNSQKVLEGNYANDRQQTRKKSRYAN